MAKKTLTIEGITFPKYSKDSSKRNFRLIFYIAYKEGSKTKTTIVTKPAEGQWQWKKSGKDAFFPEGNDLGDSVELNVMPMRAGAKVSARKIFKSPKSAANFCRSAFNL